MPTLKETSRRAQSRPTRSRTGAAIRGKPRNSLAILEKSFPSISGLVFRKARKKALRAGLSVLESQDGVIYKVFPSGVRKIVKTIEKPTRVKPGLKFKLR